MSSKGKAIVEFATSAEAAQAIVLLNGQKCDGRTVYVEKYKVYADSKLPYAEMDISRKVYISNLAYSTRSWQVKTFCKQAGKVVFGRVLQRHVQRQRQGQDVKPPEQKPTTDDLVLDKVKSLKTDAESSEEDSNTEEDRKPLWENIAKLRKVYGFFFLSACWITRL